MKPGYKTTEFWFTLVSFIFSGLYLFGILKDNEQKDQLIEIVAHALESCILIGGQLIIFYKYISSRKTEKIEVEKTKQLEEQTKQKEYTNNGDTNEQQRNDKSRSRKTRKQSKRKPQTSKKTSGRRSVEDSTNGNSKHNTDNRKTRDRSKKP